MAESSPIVAYLAAIRAARFEASNSDDGASAAVRERLARLAELRAQFDSLAAPDLTRLATWRVLASNTLRRADAAALARWDAANAHLAGALARGDRVGAALAARLNRVLTADDDGASSPVRSYDLYGGGGGRYLPPVFVADALTALDVRLAAPQGSALLEAFVAYAALVTIHPFEGGNGRTARLVADGVLLSGGWLPLCFPSPVRSHVARMEGGPPRTVAGAYKTFLDGVAYAYTCVLSVKP